MITRRMTYRTAPVLAGNKLGGYAAVFDEIAEHTGMGREEIGPGAFTRALKTSDVRALYNHDPRFVLGRQAPGTLRIWQDSTGLEYEVDLPDTSYAHDLRELVERGDIDGASFAFVPDVFEHDAERRVTRHTDIAELIDVSPVTFPAYAGASTETRSVATRGSRATQLIRARAHVRGINP